MRKEKKKESQEFQGKKKFMTQCPAAQQTGGDQPQMWRVSGQSDPSNYTVRLTRRAIVPG